jgi:hypothetical protein
MMSGSSIGDLLIRVKVDDPAIPCTTRTPISRASCENTMFGSTTFIIFSNIFF